MELSFQIFVAFAAILTVSGEILSPPLFDLAKESTIAATATCGVNITTPRERFCRLTGASADERQDFFSSLYYSGNSQIIAGQLCDYCVAERTPEADQYPLQIHSARFAIDGSEKWWQSPPLSRGQQFNDVNLTVSLGQEFQVAYVFIKMGNSPRPGVWALEKSDDYGKTWSPWQYFADSAADCRNFYDTEASDKPRSDDDVICTTEFSKITPLESGEIAVSMISDRPGANDFAGSPILQEFTKATDIRMSLRRTKTLQGHLMQLARQDPTVTRRYFYSVKDITIGGRCVCNGHADACDKQDQFKRVCECKHNTCGDSCDTCCEPFVQKKWRKATTDNPNECEPCQCFGHSNECIYDEEVDNLGLSIDVNGNYEGGGVCQNCQDNTMGTNCDQCKPGYFRTPDKSLFDKDVCQECQCDLRFTTGDCDDDTGICHCLPQYTGPDCRECAFGFYDPPECKQCDCFLNGTMGEICEVGGGQCPCKENFDGAGCNKCADGYWNFPECKVCSCNGVGSLDLVCDQLTGQCNCGFEFSGAECDECLKGYFSYPDCNFCDCDTTGTEDDVCDTNSGQCLCKENYTGDRCDKCAAGFYSYPECLPCECETTGTVDGSATCDDLGQCQCNVNFGGKKCADCAPGYHNHPTCKSCDCDLSGSFGKSCDQGSAQCDCRQNYIGLRCTQCAPDFYNFPRCEACLCNPAGAVPVPGYPLGGCGSFDDGLTLCECKENVEGHICDQCKPGFYDLTKDKAEGCKACMCHLPGTILGDNMCDPVSGQCLCKVNVNSEYCQACIPGTYNLEESSVFGCEDCNCDMGGASSTVCDDQDGQCTCRPRVTGRACNKPLQDHYFPTLHQMKYELEDGFVPISRGDDPEDAVVRFGFDDAEFPDFSWRGYAVFSRIQPEVGVVVTIDSPSVFQLIFRYINRNIETVPAEVVVTPEDPLEEVQMAKVNFPSTGSSQPEFITADSPLVLSRGKWTIALKTSDDLQVDYLVLMPQAYYEGGILQDKLRNPCMIPDSGEECLHYTYLDLSQYNQVDGGEATRPDGVDPIMETNRDILLPLDSPQLAQIEGDQMELEFNLTVKKPGKYVVVIGYVSPMNVMQPVTVTMTPEGGNSTMGKAMLYECQYSSLCRQVVIDMDTGKQILDTPSENVTIKITAEPGTVVSIGYVAAIPEEEWEDEIVKAQVMCVQAKGECVESTYPFLPDAITQDVVANHNETEELPPNVAEGTKLVKLDTEDPVVVTFNDLESQSYAIVVNYYQPDELNVPVNVTVDVNGVMYPGYFDATYCPNIAGCNRRPIPFNTDAKSNESIRESVVNFHDILIQNQIIDVLSRDAVIKIKQLTDPDARVWLDSIQLIPTQDPDTMMPMLNMLDPYDLSERYVLECTDNELDPEKGQVTPFCRSAIFSVTTEYNNGALSCDCDAQGSETFTCSEFGGQCRCKPNVIGRTCNACAQNYFGFPNCQPCNCPATCNAVTGACECPKKVTGPQCDMCAPQTFGYDRTIGCTDCNCRPEGVLNANLDCDLDTGACDCKANVVGRTCDVCENGFWNYPDCEMCDCDPAGTTQTICDRESSTCSCKDNTGGLTCGECQPGTYNLEASNPEGCTKCFCFGITSTCTSSNLIRTEIMNMTAWGLTKVNGTVDLMGSDGMVMGMLKEGAAIEGIAMYWVAPEDYIGNRLTSYGGKIKYTVNNSPEIRRGDTPDREELPGPDIQISGNGLTLSYELLSPILNDEIAVDLVEYHWRHSQSGAPVSRDQLMKVLADVDELLIKANHYANVTEVILKKVSIDSAEVPSTSDNVTAGAGSSVSLDSDFALTVEMCQCPPNYAGTSCEICAEGFFRKENAQGDFVCIPCQCNGHSDTCDIETGECKECQGNTQGENCEQCLLGYTGEPQNGEECVICACPMPIDSNNFAKDCVLDPFDKAQTIQCDCLPGFMPPFCDRCGPGYHGNPKNVSNGGCETCQCNGNIDPSDPNSCNPLDGGCLVCLNDTQGNSCEECKDFYWGDAIDAKNCEKCDCDEFGTDSCNKTNGQCICKPNVMGDRCDQCSPDTWGFLSGNGCTHCNCTIASNDTQCDAVTGDCSCQPGVTGKHCSSCLPQHWDFTAEGCKSCECELDGAVGCNVDTGICQCLAGVTGEKCDRCENRWVLIPERGCEACDNCVHTLLDDTDDIQMEIANASQSLYIINIGVEARKRLEEINATTQSLKDQLENIPAASLNSTEIDALVDNLTEVQELANRALTEAGNVETIANEATVAFDDLTDSMKEAQDSKKDAYNHLEGILEYIEDRYMDILNSSELGDVNNLMGKARDLLDTMEGRGIEFDMLLNDSMVAKNGSEEKLRRVEEWNTENNNLTAQFAELSQTLEDTTSRLEDLQVKAQDALTRSATAEELLEKVKSAITELQENTETIKTVKEDIEKTLEDAAALTNEAEDFIRNATDTFMKLEEDLTRLEAMVERLTDLYDSLVSGNGEARPKVDDAIAHADSLILEASDLSSLLDEASEAAIKAANAYSQIVTSINQAYNASQDALDNAKKAIKEVGLDGNGTSSNIQNTTEQIRDKSVELLNEAELAKNETSQELRVTLENSIDTIEGLESRNNDIEQKHSEVLFNIDNLKEDHKEEANKTRELAANAKLEAEQAVESVQPILDTLDSDLEKVEGVPVLQEQMEYKLTTIKKKMETIRSLLPNVTSLNDELSVKMPDLRSARQQLNVSISALRQKIENARSTANRIKLALKSDENTSVEIRAPEGFYDSTKLQTELSLFFQTEEENGLLLYVGPKGSASTAVRRRRQAAVMMPMEYLALELVDGHVMWKYNLGDTPAAAIKSNQTYNDNKWHQVIATRQGKEGTLTVRTDGGPDNLIEDEVTGASGGMFSQLDLMPQTARIFAGGVPDNFTLPPEVVNTRFIGNLDDYSYSENNIRLGLWNFVDGTSNANGAFNRGEELQAKPSAFVRFISSSESYITISKGSLSASSKLNLNLKFRTFNKNGIIFFLGQDISDGTVDKPDYFKLYMLDGKIYATIQLGAGELTASLDREYADGVTYEVEMLRQDNQMNLKVTNVDVSTEEAVEKLVAGPSSPKQLNLGDNPEIHIGGIPKDSNYFGNPIVADLPYFDGCVSDLRLNEKAKNILTNNVAKVGTVSGCTLVKRAVTFKEAEEGDIGTDEDTGYVQILDDVIMVGENFTIGMRFKTTADEGLLFYASSEDSDKYAFSVALKDGKIVIINTAGTDNEGEGRRNQIETMNKYNDGDSHYFQVTKTGLSLSVLVDDKDKTSADAEHRSRKTKTSPSFGYFIGGMTPTVVEYITFKDNSATWKRFIGCLSDVSIQAVAVDFAMNKPMGNYADYSQCNVADPVDPDSTTTPDDGEPGEIVSDEPTTEGPRMCTLPQEPKMEDLEEEGTRFGLEEDSRLEFDTIAGLEDVRGGLKRNNNVKMQVKTYATEGMIWMIGDTKENNPDYSTIYLDNGKVIYKCNLGSGSGMATSKKAINDGQWHSIEILRLRVDGAVTGELIIDEEEPISFVWPSGATSLNFNKPVYLGGLDMDDIRYTYMAQKLGPGPAASLVGCVDKVEYRAKGEEDWIPFGAETQSVNTQSCFENQEDGAFIPASGGALALDDKIKVGKSNEVEVSVRPRSNSGVVLLVWGGGDYLGIELNEGKVKVNVNNGAGDIEAQVDVPDICDGKWRKIKVVKNANEVTLTVGPEMEGVSDEIVETTESGSRVSTSADTKSPVYVGSIPEEVVGSRYRPISQTGYVGCIRSVRVGSKNFNMSRARKIGNVAKTCPTT